MIVAMAVLAISLIVAVGLALLFYVLEGALNADLAGPGVSMVVIALLLAVALAILAVVQWQVTS